MPHALVTKMRRRDVVSDQEAAMLEDLAGERRRYAAGETLVQAGDRLTYSSLLTAGFCGRQGVMRDGGRQFTEINVAGDFIDLHSFLLKTMDHAVIALTDCEIVPVQHQALRRLTEEQPHLGRLLWLETVVDAAIHRRWLLMLGRQDALGRLAHLVCEIATRLKVAGLSDGVSFELPLTQPVLADFLGLSHVHANRTLMALREMELVQWRRSKVTILDWQKLTDIAEFDDAYLRLTQDPV